MTTDRRIWFERSFALGLPTEAMPDIVERLRGTPDRLSERVSGAAIERLTERPDGGWSMQEHAGHLSDLESLWLGRVEDLLAGRERLRPADLDNTATWDAEHNSRPVAEILDEFRGRRGRLVQALEAMSVDALGATALHPRLEQPMTAVDLAFFVAEHDDHHLAAITKLRGGR